MLLTAAAVAHLVMTPVAGAAAKPTGGVILLSVVSVSRFDSPCLGYVCVCVVLGSWGCVESALFEIRRVVRGEVPCVCCHTFVCCVVGGSIAHWRGGGAKSERRANKACWIGERQRGERLDRHSGCEDGASVVSEHIARVAVDL